MAFDRKLDKRLSKASVDVGNYRLTVSVYSYDNNPPKVQISRMRKNDEAKYGWSFAKLGRLTKQELTEILPLLKQSLEYLT